MNNDEFLNAVKQGVEVWNKWREKHLEINVDLSKANLNRLNLDQINLMGCNLAEAHLRGTSLFGAQLRDADLNRADAEYAYLGHADLCNADLIGADLEGAILNNAEIKTAILRRAILTGAHANQVDFTAADLSGADLKGADLRRSILRNANLVGANLTGANLSESNLTHANLNEAILSEVDLSGANLREVDLLDAKIVGANLEGTNLSNGTVGWTTFNNVDLSGVRGLTTLMHVGPSSIGFDTAFLTKGRFPIVFLRGAGLPESMIENILDLAAGYAIRFYSCFISYSSKDQEFVERLHSDLQRKGVRCWFAHEDIRGGRKIHEQIPEAIKLYDKLLLVLSESSMNSEWVKTEIYYARQQERHEKRRKLFPISTVPFEVVREWSAFDSDIGKDMAREVREYFIPDFSNWKDDDLYKKAFDRLLRDLEAGDEA